MAGAEARRGQRLSYREIGQGSGAQGSCDVGLNWGSVGRPGRPGWSEREGHKRRATGGFMPRGYARGAIDEGKKRSVSACTAKGPVTASREKKKKSTGERRRIETRESGLETPCGRTLRRRTLRTLAQAGRAGARLRPAKQPLRSVLPTWARSMTRLTGDFPTKWKEPRAQHFSAEPAAVLGAANNFELCGITLVSSSTRFLLFCSRAPSDACLHAVAADAGVARLLPCAIPNCVLPRIHLVQNALIFGYLVFVCH